MAISIMPGPVPIKSLFRVYVKFSLNALVDDSRWHWFYQVALVTMLHQRYFGSRNALIHCVILNKADLYILLHRYIEDKLSTLGLFFLPFILLFFLTFFYFFFFFYRPKYTLLFNFLGVDFCHLSSWLVLPWYQKLNEARCKNYQISRRKKEPNGIFSFHKK